MAGSKPNPKAADYVNRARTWSAEFAKLREILLACGMEEDIKWGHPCYTVQNRNVVLMHGFKEYCALLFFQGALLKDPEGILIQQTENVQAGRQIRFTGVEQIVGLETVLKAYVEDAIAVEQSGRKFELKKTAEFAVPEEFRLRLDRDPSLRAAFEALTPGRQRAYLLYFSGAKQAKTRETRIEKSVPQILAGKGMDD